MIQVPFRECWPEAAVIPMEVTDFFPPGTPVAFVLDKGIMYEIHTDADGIHYWIVFRSTGDDGPLVPGIRAYKVDADLAACIRLIGLCMTTQR